MDTNSSPQDAALRTDRGRVAILTINRPERLNAYNDDVACGLMAHFSDIAADPGIGACVLTGAGSKAFCAGADLKNEATHRVASMDEHLSGVAGIGQDVVGATGTEFFEALLSFPKPLICAVNGYAIGIGFQLQLCCDLIVASTTARFKLPQVSLGIMPAYGGAPRLAQWVGRGKAAEIALTGRFVDAEEAERIGLVASLHAPDVVLDRAVEIAEAIAANLPQSLALIKESLANGLEDGQLHAASVGDIYRFMALSQTSAALGEHESWRRRKDDPDAADGEE